MREYNSEYVANLDLGARVARLVEEKLSPPDASTILDNWRAYMHRSEDDVSRNQFTRSKQ